MTRRAWLGAIAAAVSAAPKQTSIRVDEVSFAFEDIRYRAPYKFGGVAVDRATLINVNCQVRTRAAHRSSAASS